MGDFKNTEIIPKELESMSSEIIFVDFLILLSSPKDLRALVRASLKPFSWLPPLDVGMVLQKLKNSFYMP